MFEIITIDELLKRLAKYNHKEFHPHNTAAPDHKTYAKKPDPLYWQNGMKEFHMKTRGFADIAQHCTLLPDGRFVTGRDFGRQPASMTGFNGKDGEVFMVEMIGNFNYDKLDGAQKDSVMRLTKWFLDRGKTIRFHREHAATDCPGKSIVKEKFLAEARTWGENPKTIYRVQVGAYTNKTNADAMLKLLKVKGFDGFIVESTK